MKLVFPTTFDYPTRFAHPLHGLAMARAFAKILGNNFLFTHGQILNVSLLEGIRAQNLLGKKPRLIKKMRLRRIATLVWLARFCARHRASPPAFYVIDRAIAVLLIFFKLFFNCKIIFEYHALYHNWVDRMILRRADALIFLTNAMMEKTREWVPFTQPAIVLPEGIALEPFNALNNVSVTELREELRLPRDKTLIGYIGRFRPMGMDKGIVTLIEAAGSLPHNTLFYCVGGTKDEIAWYADIAATRGVADKIIFLPFQEPERIPKFARAFDILVYVPPANDFFSYYTSPMKLFEYMAARKPIIVSDLPAFREILSEHEAWFVLAGDTKQFVRTLAQILDERQEIIQKKTARAYEKVTQYTWDKRASRVIEVCKNL